MNKKTVQLGFVGLVFALIILVGSSIHFRTQSPDTETILVMDTSSSLGLRGEKQMKEAALAYLKKNPGEKIGIVAFGGQYGMMYNEESVKVIALPNANHQAVKKELPNIKIRMLGNWTALGDGLFKAKHQFGDAKHKKIIILTDGIWNTGINPAEVFPELIKKSIVVTWVQIGPNQATGCGRKEAAEKQEMLQNLVTNNGWEWHNTTLAKLPSLISVL